VHTKCIQLAITRTQPNPTLSSRGIPLDVLLSQFAILDFMMFACETDFSALPTVIVVFALVTFAIRVQSAICLNDKIRKWKWKWRQPPDAISHARNLSFAIQGPDFRNRKSLISNWTWPVSGGMHSSYTTWHKHLFVVFWPKTSHTYAGTFLLTEICKQTQVNIYLIIYFKEMCKLTE